MSLYLDLTEFLTNPMRTGIQRISGEICRHLPQAAAIPVKLFKNRYVVLPATVIDAIATYFRDPAAPGIEDIRRLGAGENRSPVQISRQDTVLVPEVFDNPPRLAFFQNFTDDEIARCRFIIYDLLRITHPEYFVPEAVVNFHGYCDVLKRLSNCGFISDYTRETYYGRLRRTRSRDGVVLGLGADALGPRPERVSLNRPLTFSVLGTIEPRKNHALILDAFEPLLGKVRGLTLQFIGNMGWADSRFVQKVQSLAAQSDSGFRFFSAPDDGAIRRHIEASRATLYVSAAEGYGLPPVESLWVGTPVIASDSVPSLVGMGGGVHIVSPLNPINLRRAVLAFLDDEYANRMAEEAAEVKLPTWNSFTQDVLAWCA